MCENEPSEDEQEEAWQYCCQRVLERPDTDARKVLKCIGIFLLSVFGCMFFIYALFPYVLVALIVLAVLVLIGLLLYAKAAIIGLVKLYQHYAPERIRRKCIFKPTCSEYMILVIEKYGVVKGLYKGLFRLFVRCKGFYYSIDYP